MSETIVWNEDVLLENGQQLSIQRELTFGPNEWGQSGKGGLKNQSIRFSFNGKKVKWENDDKWPIPYTPDILDFVNGIPILVMPVYRWGPCNKYDFPQEGLVVFGYRNGTWVRIPITDVPKTLKVNLLRSTHEIRHWDEYRNRRITPSVKLELESGITWGGAKAGQTISESSKFYASKEKSCARIHPLPDVQMEAANAEITKREANARQLTAQIQSSSDSPNTISPNEFLEAQGELTGAGYRSKNCKGVLDRIEHSYHYGDRGSQQLVGYTLFPTSGHPIPLHQSNLKLAPAGLNVVVCNQSFIISVRRQSKDYLIINRFFHSGAPVDVLHIKLPDIEKFFAEGQWPMMWNVLVNDEKFTFTLGTYSKEKHTPGVVLERQVSYIIAVPK